MADKKIYVGDIGTGIILESGEDLTDQTTLEIRYIKPSGVSGTWDAMVHSTNTQAIYGTVDGDLDEDGLWKFQLYVELPSWEGHGTIATVEVFPLKW